MGRVSKYKKLKACDPFAKKRNNSSTPTHADVFGVWGLGDSGRRVKKRSLTATKLRQAKSKRRKGGRVVEKDEFDLPPDGEDEFTLSNLSVKKEKRQRIDNGLVGEERNETLPVTPSRCEKETAPSGLGAVIPRKKQDEALREARMLKLNLPTASDATKKGDRSKIAKGWGRMEGESMRAFERRINNETREMIKQNMRNEGNDKSRTNPEKQQRKKEFLNKRKAKKRKGKANFEGGTEGTQEDKRDASFVTGERAIATAVAFGETAERPPVFTHLPRGAASTKKEQPEGASFRCTPLESVGGRTRGMDEKQIDAENKAMEAMRKKVQAQYALVKARRKKAGDFHL